MTTILTNDQITAGAAVLCPYCGKADGMHDHAYPHPCSAPSPQIAEKVELPGLAEIDKIEAIIDSTLIFRRSAEGKAVGRLLKQVRDAIAASRRAAPRDVCAEMRALCSACGGTGDVVSLDGEWRGTCDCEASRPPKSEGAAANPVSPTGEQLYTMVTSRFKGGSLPWAMTSESGKAAWNAAAAELAFAPDTIMACYATLAPASAGQAAPAAARNYRDEEFLTAARVALVALAHAAEKHGIYQTDHDRFAAAVEKFAAQPAEGAGQAGQVAKSARLSESAVRQLALLHASAASGGEHYEFDQQGMDAFAIDIMDAVSERAAAPADEKVVCQRCSGSGHLYNSRGHYYGKCECATHQPSAQKGGDA